jgi:hypothetical protein
VSSALPEAKTLMQELLNFRVKVSLSTGHESFEAWRERDSDDLVLALACALWYAKRAELRGVQLGPTTLVPGKDLGEKKSEEWLEW